VQSQEHPGGARPIGAAPVPPRSNLQLTITTEGRLTRTDEFDHIVVRANPDGSVVRVKDRSARRSRRQDEERYSRSTAPRRGNRIYQSPGANAVDVARQCRETLDQLKQRFPTMSPTRRFGTPPFS